MTACGAPEVVNFSVSPEITLIMEPIIMWDTMPQCKVLDKLWRRAALAVEELLVWLDGAGLLNAGAAVQGVAWRCR